MKFLYGEGVKVIRGFYYGQAGYIIDWLGTRALYTVEMRVVVGNVCRKIEVNIEEDYLEAN